MGLVAVWPMGSSRIKDWTSVSCIGRQILYHWAPGKPKTSLCLIGTLILISTPNFLPFCGCFYFLEPVLKSTKAQTLYILMMFTLFLFSLLFVLHVLYLRNYCLIGGLEDISMFSSKCFINVALIFGFDLFWKYMIWDCRSSFILLYVNN